MPRPPDVTMADAGAKAATMSPVDTAMAIGIAAAGAGAVTIAFTVPQIVGTHVLPSTSPAIAFTVPQIVGTHAAFRAAFDQSCLAYTRRPKIWRTYGPSRDLACAPAAETWRVHTHLASLLRSTRCCT